MLRESGFADRPPDGTRRLYSVEPDAPADVDVWLDRFRRFWAPPLDALATELARGKPRVERRQEENVDDRRRRTDQRRARRTVGARVEAGEARTVTISQIYAADVDDVWDACTNAERIPRWFLPCHG